MINSDSKPLVVSKCSGVGAKLKIAVILNKHDTIGVDCVASCVNELLCSGAECEFFQSHISCGKDRPDKFAEIVSGLEEGCKEADCTYLGNEVTEMHDIYNADQYDLIGFAVGTVDGDKVISNEEIKPGDAIIGLASTGLQCDGFASISKVFKLSDEILATYFDSLGSTLGEELIRPAKIYVNAIRELRRAGIKIKGLAYDSCGLSSCLEDLIPEGMHGEVKKNSFEKPPVFEMLKESGDLSEEFMFNTFNMGIGMIAIVDDSEKKSTIVTLDKVGEKAFIIGTVKDGEGPTELV